MQQRAVLAALDKIQNTFKQQNIKTELPNLIPFTVNQDCIVNQNYSDLVEFCPLFKQIKEFEPAGKYGFVSKVKFKLKWRYLPSHQVVIEKWSKKDRIFSLFNPNAYNCYRNQIGDRLAMFPTITDHVYICLTNSNDWFKNTTKSDSVTYQKVLLEHRSYNSLIRLNIPSVNQIKVAGAKLELIGGYWHNNYTLDRHGLYAHRVSRNKTLPKHTDFDAESSDVCVIDKTWKLMIVEVTSPISNKVLFNSP